MLDFTNGNKTDAARRLGTRGRVFTGCSTTHDDDVPRTHPLIRRRLAAGPVLTPPSPHAQSALTARA